MQKFIKVVDTYNIKADIKALCKDKWGRIDTVKEWKDLGFDFCKTTSKLNKVISDNLSLLSCHEGAYIQTDVLGYAKVWIEKIDLPISEYKGYYNRYSSMAEYIVKKEGTEFPAIYGDFRYCEKLLKHYMKKELFEYDYYLIGKNIAYKYAGMGIPSKRWYEGNKKYTYLTKRRYVIFGWVD